MAYFVWKESYNTNISVIDTQHQRLVELLNRLYEAMRSGQGREAAGTILEELVSYTREHFSTEERLMRAAGYPGAAGHEQDHTRLTAQVVAYQEDFKKGKSGVALQISALLKDWLARHILETDKQYAGFLIDKGMR